MKVFSAIFLAVLLFSISSCKQDPPAYAAIDNYLIFGHFYGLCVGEGCVEIFMLTDKMLYEDLNDNYLPANFSFTELSSDKFEQVKNLVDSIPPQLLNETKDVFGCPDCADQGGLYIEYAKDGNVNSWRIDQSKNATPAYLHDFMDLVNQKIYQINN
jgi:hypothetical protein